MQREIIPIARPVLDEREAEAARRAILSGWITQGAEVAAFEKEFSAYVGALNACAVSSCTTALHMALLALDIGPDDEVITVSHSYIATANAIVHAGATPVFIDVCRDSFNMDPALISDAITPQTKAIICVHQMGMPCEMGSIVRVARQHGLAVIEDAACAAGSEITDDFLDVTNCRIGKPLGDIVCFSFHPRKVLTTGDGGMLTTDDPALDARFRLLRQHGMSVPDTVRHASREVVFENYPTIGYNYRMTDIQAAIGREQLKRMPAMIAERRGQASYYRDKLGDINWLMLPEEPEWAKSNWQSFCILLDRSVDQRGFMQYLLDNKISTRRGIMCAHRELAYENIGKRGSSLEQSEYCQDQGVVLPLFSGLNTSDQDYIIEKIRKFPTRDERSKDV